MKIGQRFYFKQINSSAFLLPFILIALFGLVLFLGFFLSVFIFGIAVALMLVGLLRRPFKHTNKRVENGNTVLLEREDYEVLNKEDSGITKN